MANVFARGDRMVVVANEIQAALDAGGIATGFTLTTSDYAEIDATTADGTKLEIRVEIRK